MKILRKTKAKIGAVTAPSWILRALPIIGCIVSSVSYSNAQVIVTYSEGSIPSEIVENVSATPIEPGSLDYFDGEFVEHDGSIDLSPTSGSTSAALAVTNDQFFEFTITPDPVGKLNLVALGFEADHDGDEPSGWVVRSSLDGFATDLGTAQFKTEHPSSTTFSVILPSDLFIGLTQPVTFRIYTFGPNGGSTAIHYDNIQVLGMIDRPPRIVLPGSKKVRSTKPRYRVRGFAFDDEAVVRVTANGRTIRGTNRWSTTVRLKNRKTRVRFQAIDSAKLVSRRVLLTITRNPRAALRKPINFLQ